VDKILRTTRPADIPVEQPTKFDLAVNLVAAKVPSSNRSARFLLAKIVQRFVASALVELGRVELAIRLGLHAAHEEAFLDDLAVPDGVKSDLIEVHAFLALWRDV
jgi:hypothetical protein